jgi:hypothetical protein
MLRISTGTLWSTDKQYFPGFRVLLSAITTVLWIMTKEWRQQSIPGEPQSMRSLISLYIVIGYIYENTCILPAFFRFSVLPTPDVAEPVYACRRTFPYWYNWPKVSTNWQQCNHYLPVQHFRLPVGQWGHPVLLFRDKRTKKFRKRKLDLISLKTIRVNIRHKGKYDMLVELHQSYYALSNKSGIRNVRCRDTRTPTPTPRRTFLRILCTRSSTCTSTRLQVLYQTENTSGVLSFFVG